MLRHCLDPGSCFPHQQHYHPVERNHRFWTDVNAAPGLSRTDMFGRSLSSSQSRCISGNSFRPSIPWLFLQVMAQDWQNQRIWCIHGNIEFQYQNCGVQCNPWRNRKMGKAILKEDVQVQYHDDARNLNNLSPGVDFTKGFKTWHKFSTEIRFMLIPISVLFIAHEFIMGNF